MDRSLSRAARRRMAAEAFDPDRAPHRDLVHELLVAQLPPLQVRLRAQLVDELVREVVRLERDPVPLVEESPDEQRAHLAARVEQVIVEQEAHDRALVREFRTFGTVYASTKDEERQRELVAEYLRESVGDADELRRDLAAMKRHLGFDTLRERNQAAVLRCGVLIELGLLFLGGVAPAIRLADEAGGAPTSARGSRLGALAEFCAARQLSARRWQTRMAAGQAVVAIADAASEEITSCTPVLLEVARNRDEHPWVQALALEGLVLLDPRIGRDLLANRLYDAEGGVDFCVRKLALGIARRRLPAEVTATHLTRIVDARDPSDHVRLGLVEAAAALPWPSAAPLLAALSSSDEVSPKVRARVAMAARARAGAAALDDDDATARDAAALLLARLEDRDELPLIVACDELSGLASELGSRRPALLEELAPAWLSALGALIAAPDTRPRVVELAAAAAEAVERERDPVRRALTRHLSEVVARIPVGGEGVVELDALPPELAAAAGDPELVSRVFAELTRDDWGVSLTHTPSRLRVWRGERLRRRLWRILHELRHPLPNKRQAWVHTTGRVYPGSVRAHPGALDEATATTVPGERVTVDAEGSWARHLPMVDDVLDLPVLRPRPVQVASSLGISTVQPPPSLLQRIRNRFAVSWHYRTLAGMRLASLRATHGRDRRQFADELERSYGITLQFAPHARPASHGEPAPSSPRTDALFAAPAPADADADAERDRSSTTTAALVPLGDVMGWVSDHQGYFSSPFQNSQAALVVFGAGLTASFFLRSWVQRRRIAGARASIPLTIGGWGTRGKSGTERLKAGLLDGLGFEVFVKTTGCEAMFIHSAPMQQPVEIFIYRPYDKATIWEQRAQLELASRLRCQVFLWECMALNPKYVELLQRDWMNDDLVTLTNCYPDHEDIQGPAGFNVANVITEFIPTRGTLVTSETSYLPLFRDVCAHRGTTMHAVGEREAELIADDMLELFPYREHPRNIALVTRVAEELGIDPDLAQFTMAQNVVPDLGVLKAYPRARVRGRLLTFVCGNSANERTGFMNNWRRMNLDRLDTEREPARLVVTVVNNRADRIARSEVFARILVRDVAFDRHVLIGTNLEGLRGYIDAALDDYLAEVRLVEPDELAAGEVPAAVAARIERLLAALRIPVARSESLLVRLRLYAEAASLQVDETQQDALDAALAPHVTGDPTRPIELGAARRMIDDDGALTAALAAALTPRSPPEAEDDCPETIAAPTQADVLEHFRFELARVQIRADVEARLRGLFAKPSEPARVGFRTELSAAYRTLFLAQVRVVESSAATGDQIIDFCARTVPPGSEVTLMGTQNIKGTGLDFVYRWLALDLVVRTLREQDSPREERRLAALAELEAFEDHGLVDTGLARAILARTPRHAPSPDEIATRARIASKVETIWTRRLGGLAEQRRAGFLDRLAAWGEGWLDWMDSMRRTHAARQIVDDLVHHRISHGRASVEMRALVGRIKGGWLIKALRR